MLTKQLIINITDYETRVALIESGQVSEYYIERAQDKSLVGSIFKGVVQRVLPGIQSCFVDIGLNRAAFLYAGDVQIAGSAPTDVDLEDEDTPKKERTHHAKIEDLVKVNQEVFVQVLKDAIGTKGPRVTTYISLPGRYVVLMPNIPHVGVSRKVSSDEERARLKSILLKSKSKDVGLIARTACDKVAENKIVADIEFLKNLWETIKTKLQTSDAPALLHEDLGLVFRATRDLMVQNLDRIVIDNKKYYKDLVTFLNRFSIKFGARVQLHSGEAQIFDAFGIEHEINHALGAKIWLKSGGYLIIEETEALTAIDVNTGRFVGKRSQDETILRTNFEAAKEIVHQIRLRNIGGIIILDFIDMYKSDDRDKIFQALVEELKTDKAKTSVLRISEMGLVQMTRKRTEASLSQKISTECHYCDGSGSVKSPETVVYEIFREFTREFKRNSHTQYILKAHSSVVDRIFEEDKEFFDHLKQKYKKKVQIESAEEFHVGHFEISFGRAE